MNKTKELGIIAAATSSERDFDFFIGEWRIRNRKLDRRLAGCDDWTEFEATGECRKVLGGMGNVDSFSADHDGSAFEGMAVRLFSPADRLWRIYWADNRRGVLDPPQTGSFENEVGEFLARDVFEGRDIVVKFRWDATDPLRPLWSQAFSADDGASWEWNWHMEFERL